MMIKKLSHMLKIKHSDPRTECSFSFKEVGSAHKRIN